MRFKDRYKAGKVLADILLGKNLSQKDTVIAAIPRGGVLVALPISDILNLPIGVIVIKKLVAPQNRELAIGATASFGKPVLDRWLIADLGISQKYLKEETIKKKKEAKSREKMLGIKLDEVDFKNKNVIVVDDGIATGQTAKAAGIIISKFFPKSLILAVPCSSKEAINMIRGIYREIICPIIRDDFRAVGEYYKDFSQVDDWEVKKILEYSHIKK